MIIPRVKYYSEKNHMIKFSRKIKINCSLYFLDFMNIYSKIIHLGIKFFKESTFYDMQIIEDKNDSEEYYINIDDEMITMKCGNLTSLRNSIATFFQLVMIKDAKFFLIQQCEISDYPDISRRSVLIDLARGLPDKERLKQDLIRLSLLKNNIVHFHLMDRQGFCYDTKIFEHKKQIRGTELYSKKDIKDIVSYCKKLAIKVLPGIEAPSHAFALIEYNKDLKCVVKNESVSSGVVCGGNEKTYLLFDKLIKEISELFPYEYIHVGGDELYFKDHPLDWKWQWDECEVCNKYMEKNHISDKKYLYYHFMNRLNDSAKKYNKKIIMWSDEIDFSMPVTIDKDITIEYWTYNESHYKNKFEYKDFLDSPYEKIISPCQYTYIDLESLSNLERISSFNPITYGNPSELNKKLIKGAEVCAWEYGNPRTEYSHYRISFFCSSALLLDKFWNTVDAKYTNEFEIALTKIFGGIYTSEEFNFYGIFGSIMPPRSDRGTYLDKDCFSVNDIKKYEKVLEKLYENTYSKFMVKDILYFLEGWKNNWQENKY